PAIIVSCLLCELPRAKRSPSEVTFTKSVNELTSRNGFYKTALLIPCMYIRLDVYRNNTG
ncbi:hypothetical protein NDU88_000810, partial [Pleurodeles waltl]